MSESDKKKPNRRDFILTATTAAGAVGVGAAAWPLIDQMNPDASVKALASTEVDISGVEPGQSITVLWRGKPVFIRRRTSEEIAKAKDVNLDDLPHPGCGRSSKFTSLAFAISSLVLLPVSYTHLTLPTKA